MACTANRLASSPAVCPPRPSASTNRPPRRAASSSAGKETPSASSCVERSPRSIAAPTWSSATPPEASGAPFCRVPDVTIVGILSFLLAQRTPQRAEQAVHLRTFRREEKRSGFRERSQPPHKRHIMCGTGKYHDRDHPAGGHCAQAG